MGVPRQAGGKSGSAPPGGRPLPLPPCRPVADAASSPKRRLSARQQRHHSGAAEFKYLHGSDAPWEAPASATSGSTHRDCYVDSGAHAAARASALATKDLPRRERERRWMRWMRHHAAAGAAVADEDFCAAARATGEVAAARRVSHEARDEQWQAWLLDQRRRVPGGVGTGPGCRRGGPPGCRGACARSTSLALGAAAEGGRPLPPTVGGSEASAAMLQRYEQMWHHLPTGRPTPSAISGTLVDEAAALSASFAGAASVLPAGAVIGGASSIATVAAAADTARCRGSLCPPVVLPEAGGAQRRPASSSRPASTRGIVCR